MQLRLNDVLSNAAFIPLARSPGRRQTGVTVEKFLGNGQPQAPQTAQAKTAASSQSWSEATPYAHADGADAS